MSYRRWDEDYWEGQVREVLGSNHLLCDVWHWLVSSVHASSIGVYRVPFRALSTACFLSGPDAAKRAVCDIHALVGPLGKMAFEPETGWVWIVNAARKQHDPINRPEDKRRRGKALTEELERAASSPFWGAFLATYAKHLCIDASDFVKEGPSKDLLRTSEGPSKVIRMSFEGDPDPSPSLPFPSLPNPTQPSVSGLAPLPPVESKKLEPTNPDVGAIFDAWNEIHGSRFTAKNRALAGNVKARLDEGHTVDEFALVAEWVKKGDKRAAKLREDGYAVPSTAWAQSHFATYLELAKQWKAGQAATFEMPRLVYDPHEWKRKLAPAAVAEYIADVRETLADPDQAWRHEDSQRELELMLSIQEAQRAA